MNEDSPLPFSPDIGAIARGIIYLFSLYAAFYTFSRQKDFASKPAFLRTESEPSSDNSGEKRQDSPEESKVELSCLPFSGPAPRAESKMTIDKTSGNVIVHGGKGHRGTLADIQIFHSEVHEWAQFPFSPNERQKFSLVAASDGLLVIFGGLDRHGRASDVLNTVAFSQNGFDWTDRDSRTTNKAGAWPAARYGHAMCLIEDDRVAMFGGHDSSGKLFSDMWLLNTNVLVSSKIDDGKEKQLWVKAERRGYTRQPIGTRPRPRKAPSIACMDGKIFLFGKALKTRARGEVDLFNLTTHKWEMQVTSGEEPLEQDCQVHSLPKVAKLVAVSNKDTSICGIFNRISVLDSATMPMTWAQVGINWIGDFTMIPGTRTRFASAMDCSEGLLYIFGGFQSKKNEEEGQELLGTMIVANFSIQS